MGNNVDLRFHNVGKKVAEFGRFSGPSLIISVTYRIFDLQNL